jgi:hypothetical protein
MAELTQNLSSILNSEPVMIEGTATVPVSDDEMNDDISISNENFEIDKEALENELLETTGDIRNFDQNEEKTKSNFQPFDIAQLPRIRHKIKVALEKIPEPKLLTQSPLGIKKAQPKQNLDLSQLFSSPVITPVDRAPINADSYQGKMAILARKARDAKIRARNLCIDTASSIPTHLENWEVIYLILLN